MQVSVSLSDAEVAMLQRLAFIGETPEETILSCLHQAAFWQSLGSDRSLRAPSTVKRNRGPFTNEAAKQFPQGWASDDPRAVVSTRYDISLEELAAVRERVGATEAELIAGCKWVLQVRVAQGVARQRLERVLQMKASDRKEGGDR